MKKILITGSNSYIGTSFKKWVSQYPDEYSVDTISLRDDNWKEESFEGYDVILHLAAIVHIKENDINKYFKINRDLTLEVAKKSKSDGVKHFVFLSTMGVYGTETGYIAMNTVPKPKTPYAKSKYEAEKLLLEIQDNTFKVAILRPPIVYGKGCGGNYPRLANLALKLPIFPGIDNQRSMIFIDNLSEFIRLTIDKCFTGIYFPQNKDYVNTTELVSLIRQPHGKEIKVTRLFNWAITIGLRISGTFRKVFGSFIYDKEMQGGPVRLANNYISYETVSFEESIKLTESKGKF